MLLQLEVLHTVIVQDQLNSVRKKVLNICPKDGLKVGGWILGVVLRVSVSIRFFFTEAVVGVSCSKVHSQACNGPSIFPAAFNTFCE